MVKLSVRKPLTIFVAALAIIILGVVAFVKMTPDLLPNMDFPYVVIMTTYPGASPESVEAEVTKPLEQSMSTLEHIKTVSSTSNENYSVVMLEFENSVNMDTIGVDIQQNISALSTQWSENVGTPYVLKINPSLLPVEVVAVSMSGMNSVALSDFVSETLLPRLEGVTGVASISTIGSITQQVHVLIDENMIASVNDALATVVNQQLDDAITELEGTKSDLEEAQTQLETAQAQLETGKAALVSQTAAAETTLSQQQIAALSGRMEIQQQILSLTQTKTQLETTLAIINPIYEQLTTLETTETELSSSLASLQDVSDRLAVADATLSQYNDSIAAIQADETLTEEEKASSILLITESEEYISAQNAVAAIETELTNLGTDRYQLPITIVTQTTELTTVQTELAAVDATLTAMDMDRESLSDSVTEMNAGLTQADDALTLLNDTLSQLDSGTIQLSDASGVLSQAQSSGILELADAATQLAVNSASLESALSQVESGLDSIEDSREDALAAADITDTVTISMVSSILSAQNFSMPAGYVEQDGINYMVSVGDKITDLDELSSLLLFDTGEDGIGPVYLRDVAQIFITDNTDSTYARLNRDNGLILSFEKQSNTATADVTDNLSKRFNELEDLYPGLEFVSLMNQGDYIYMIVESILESLVTGALFAIIILFLFLHDIRPTFITLVSIPISVVFAVVLMYFTGVTLNMISLSGLAVSVGMLVDNSIVVIENIYRLRAKGATAVQASVAGARQVAGAITSSTLTTVCVFLPIVFVEGITRQLFTDLALTMGYALMASLIIALTLVPAMSRGMLKDRRRKRAHEKSTAAPVHEGLAYRVYRKLISAALHCRILILLAALAALILSAHAAISKGFSYMPEIDMNTVSLTLSMPEDATYESASSTADEVLTRILAIDSVETVGAMMGGNSFLSVGSEGYDITVYVTLREGESGAAVGRRIVSMCYDLDCQISYDSSLIDMSYLSGSGVAVNVYGNDMQLLQSTARSIAETLSMVPGVTSTDDGLQDAEKALHVFVDKNAAMQKGYTVAQLFMDIANELTDSATAITMEINGVTTDVIVETSSGLTREELSSMTFTQTNKDGASEEFQLSDVAQIEDTVSLSTISRADQRRYVSVTATVDEDHNVTLVTADAQRAVSYLQIPEGISYDFAGENEAIMDAMKQLGLMIVLGIILVYFIMVAQFQSLKSPFIVMFTIPLAFTGGFLALLICHMDISIVSLIGFVMLTGIIVNNGIVLVDYINQLRASGMSRRKAIIEACVTRLRPILMTSLTTILGLIVMALGRDVGTSLMQPVAVVCIGGLLYATLMTLFVVPCIYDLVNRKPLKVVSEDDMEYHEL